MTTDEREPDIGAVVDFLDAWRYCPVSSAQKPARECLERAAHELLATLPIKARVEAAEQRVRELELDYEGLRLVAVEAQDERDRAEAKLATAVEALREIAYCTWTHEECEDRARRALSEIEQGDAQ